MTNETTVDDEPEGEEGNIVLNPVAIGARVNALVDERRLMGEVISPDLIQELFDNCAVDLGLLAMALSSLDLGPEHMDSVIEVLVDFWNGSIRHAVAAPSPQLN